MKCVVCGNETDFENLDSFREKPCQMTLCLKCGMVRHFRFKDIEDYYSHYLGTDYRQPPNCNNYYTGNLKLKYHDVFLKEFIEKLREREMPKLCDIGTANGMFLNWLGSQFPPKPKIVEKDNKKVVDIDPKTNQPIFEKQVELYGTELTESFVRNAFWEYGLRLTKDIDTSVKYDMICAYKVLEHIYDIDEKLKQYRDCLKDDGYFYVSNPTWFNTLHLFGSSEQTTFDKYFHPDHINVWSENHSKNMLKKAGFKIIKENYTLYDSTYMCIKTDEKQELIYEDPAKIKDAVERIKKAIDTLRDKKDPKKAIEFWSEYPEAHMHNFEVNRKEIHASGGYERAKQEILEPALKACPNSPDMRMLCAEIALRYEQFNDSLDYIQKALEMRPNSPNFVKVVATLYHKMFIKTQDLNYLLKSSEAWLFIARNFPNETPQALNWLYGINAMLPIPDEKNN